MNEDFESQLDQLTIKNRKLLQKHPELKSLVDEIVDRGSNRGFDEEMSFPLDEFISVVGDSPGISTKKLVYETVVRTVGRPVLPILSGSYEIPATKDYNLWREPLTASREILAHVIPSVGRIEVPEIDFPFVGTGWLVDDDLLITNRHVATVFAARAQDGTAGFRFRPGRTARIDFLEEYERPNALEFSLIKVLHIEDRNGPDIAYFKVARTSGATALPPPLVLYDGPVNLKQQIAAIGYPTKQDDFPEPELMLSIFKPYFDKKVLAPGEVDTVSEGEFTHDCSTLKGNSGSTLVDLATGQAVGIHFGGSFLEYNVAVPSTVIAKRLRSIQRGESGAVVVTTDGITNNGKLCATNDAERESFGGPPEQVTWTIPLQVTVQFGKPAVTGLGVSQQVTPSAGGYKPKEDDLHLPKPAKKDVTRAVEAATREAKKLLGESVVAVREGYRFANGWITDEPAVVVAVSGRPGESEAFRGKLRAMPKTLHGVPVEVRAAGPRDLVRKAGIPLTLEAVFSDIGYKPPPGGKLEAVNEQMDVTCHVSPENGWEELEKFLGRTKHRLTVGMFDFGAPHIFKAIKEAIGPAFRKLNLVIQKGESVGKGTKKFDLKDAKVVEELRDELADRFTQSWAALGKNGLFSNSYHIKVAVRDGKEFWLSSGNWQSSNQPDLAALGLSTRAVLQKYNREWHAIVTNDKLAKTYEKYLLWDLEEAAKVLEGTELPVLMIDVPESYLDFVLERADFTPKFFDPLKLSRKVNVAPLLTPDNYADEVLKLIKSADEKLYFQNQTLAPLAENEEKFEELLDAIKEKQQAGLDVRIIFRQFFGWQDDLEAIKRFGIKVTKDKVRVQPNCHTKGIIVDSKTVVVGSHNWTNSGALYNRDASLIFRDEQIAKHFEKVFLYDWENLTNRDEVEESPFLSIGDDGEVADGIVRMPWWMLETM